MRRGHKINIFTAAILQIEHDGSQSFIGHFPAPAFVTDIEVLTEITAQTAIGEKDRTRPSPAYQYRFFTEVRAMTADLGIAASLTETALLVTAINSAASRTEMTTA